MDQERNQSMFFRTRHFGRFILFSDLIISVLRGFRPFPQLLGMLGTLTGTYIVMHRKGRKEFLLFQHPRTSLIYWLYWFPVASGRTKSPILGCSIVLIKKISCRNTFFISEAVSFVLYICLWHNF